MCFLVIWCETKMNGHFGEKYCGSCVIWEGGLQPNTGLQFWVTGEKRLRNNAEQQSGCSALTFDFAKQRWDMFVIKRQLYNTCAQTALSASSAIANRQEIWTRYQLWQRITRINVLPKGAMLVGYRDYRGYVKQLMPVLICQQLTRYLHFIKQPACDGRVTMTTESSINTCA